LSTLTYNRWTSAFTAKFNSNLTLDAFEAVIQQSPLLTDLLNHFSGSIDISGPGKPQVAGTGYSSQHNTIYVDPTILPSGSGPPYTAQQLATALAHELGHALLPHGSVSAVTASDPTQAVNVGLTDEGTAVAAEFAVAMQLSASIAGQLTGFSPTLIQNLTAALPAGGAASLSSMGLLKTSTNYMNQATALGAADFAKERPSNESRTADRCHL
jgi:hypothetical protein